ncbi:thioredoxin domain-containing protein [Patescibacteria group bacterium]|nr:thioredoxin domain-containing protein [Patescibacteria group bacterium]
MKRLLLLGGMVGTMLMPLTTFAATSQQLLDAGIKARFTQTLHAQNVAIDIDLQSTTKVLRKVDGAQNQSTHARVTMTADTFARSETYSDGIFVLRVPEFRMDQGTGSPVSVKNPFTLELRMIDHVIYVRISDVSPLLLAQLPASVSAGFDIRSLIGTWIKIDPKELGADLTELKDLNPASSVTQQADLETIKKFLAGPSLLQVVSTEKRVKNAKGEQQVRLHVRLNPKFIDYAMKLQADEQKKTLGYAPTAKELATQKADLQKILKGLQMVAVMNIKTGALDRMEASYTSNTPVYRYVYTGNTSKKYNNGNTKVVVKVGVSLQALADRQVPIPEGLVSLKTLLDQWKQATAIPTEPMPLPSDNNPFDYPAEPTPAPVAPPVSVPPVNGTDHIKGNPQAPVTMILYSDFECPFCQRFSPSIERILAEFPQSTRLVYRHFPLSFHPYAQVSAEASECAGRVGGSHSFWSMYDAIRANETHLETVSWTTLATQIGLNPQTFDACMNMHEGADKVNADVLSAPYDVSGTPTVFVNGTPIVGAVPYETLRQAVVDAGAVN